MSIRSIHIAALLLTLSVHASAGVFGEHKKMGDQAFRRFLVTEPMARGMLDSILGCSSFSGANASLIPITTTTNSFLNVRDYDSLLMLFQKDGMGITYGDLTGMSGDHSVDGFALFDAFSTSWRYGANGIDLNSDLNENFFTNLRLHMQAINNGARAANPFDLSYILLAFEDQSHFHAIDQTVRRELEDIDPLLLRQVFEDMAVSVGSSRRDVVERLFHTNAAAKYAMLHTLGLHMASIAGNLLRAYRDQGAADFAESKTAVASMLRLGLLMQAFGDHYLQDMFAAGHLVTHNQHAFVLYGLDMKAIHDHYNRVGVDVVIPATGRALHLLGDDFMGTSTIDAGVDAVHASLREFWNAFASKLTTPEPFDGSTWLQDHIVARAEPASYLAAFRYVPQPPVGEHRDSTITFLYPRSGPYCGLGAGVQLQNNVASGWVEGFYGLGFPIVVPSDDSPREQILGGGFQLNAGYATGFNMGSTMAGFDLWLLDQFHVQALAGAVVQEGWHGAGRIGIGYDYHPFDGMLGLRCMVGMQAISTMQPMIGIMFTILRY
jgi:hypothetical protein